MLENKEQEKIAGIISDFFDGAVNEADIDILAMKIYEKYVAKLEQELAELKEKAIVPRFRIGQEVWAISVYRLNCVDSFIITEIGYCAKYGLFYKTNMGINLYEYYYLIFATEQEAQAKLKEIQGNE